MTSLALQEAHAIADQISAIDLNALLDDERLKAAR